jgi:2-isopropylmalate synthase
VRRIRVLDTTLRDGDQAAGFAFSAEQKITLARALAEAGVDIIETGFPLSSPGELGICRRIALDLAELPLDPVETQRPLTAVMCRGRLTDIKETVQIFQGGIPGVLHISLPVSKTHITAKFGKTETELLALAREVVSFAAGLVPMVELGAEDASRADAAFLADYCANALDAGAGIINIADTLGVLAPATIANLVRFLCNAVSPFALGKAVLSVHCHNDFGLACANTLAAIEAGCGQVEVSVSGIGERAGNAALEEVLANLQTRPELYHAQTRIRPEKMAPVLGLAAAAAGTAGSPMKPLSGWNIRAFSSGLHQQGLSKNTKTYAPVLPEPFTMVPERIVLSRHSGRAGVALFARRYCGMDLDPQTLSQLTLLVKAASGVSTGLTEFIRMLVDLHALTSAYPGPFIRTTGSETTEMGGITRYRITATLSRYQGPAFSEEAYPLTGTGASWTKVVLEAVSRCTGMELQLNRLGINGGGDTLRLYGEIRIQGKLYGIERIGSSPGLLLLDCCLDGVNGTVLAELQETVRRPIRPYP